MLIHTNYCCSLPNTVLVKLPSGEMKRTTMKQGEVEVTRVPKPTTSGPMVGQKIVRPDQKSDKKEVGELFSTHLLMLICYPSNHFCAYDS